MILADGAGSPIDQGVATWLMVGAVFLGWVGIARLRGRAFRKMPRWLGWTSTGLAGVAVGLALVLPPIIRPNAPATRPSTHARLAIESPGQGEVFRGDPAPVPVRIRLTGGKIVPFTSTKLVPDTGHVHVFLDGNLVAMTTTLQRTIEVLPGHHTLSAEFVAVDHAPFEPRVLTSVQFLVDR